jgi:hypothetical protein
MLKKKSISGNCCTFAPKNGLNFRIMDAIIERTPRTVTVRMSTRRWNRLQQMEQAYKLAHTIKRSMKQAETAPSMTVEEALKHLDEL